MTENRTAEWINFAVSRAGDIPVIGGRIRKVSMTYGPRPNITQSSPSRLSSSSDTQPPPSYSSVERNNMVAVNEISSKSIIERINSKQLTKLDRQSIIQGLRMVELAAVEYQEGNDTIALDIYLHGLDKIVMGLPGMYFIYLCYCCAQKLSDPWFRLRSGKRSRYTKGIGNKIKIIREEAGAPIHL